MRCSVLRPMPTMPSCDGRGCPPPAATTPTSPVTRRRREWQPGSTSPGFVPFDDTDDPDDPAADFDVPYGDGSPVPRSLQVGPLPVLAGGAVALTGGLILGFAPLVALGVVGLVGGLALFAVAPIYAVMRSSRRGLD